MGTSPKASPVQSQFPSQAASPVGTRKASPVRFTEQRNQHGTPVQSQFPSQAASPVRFTEQRNQHGTPRYESRFYDRRASPGPSPIAEEPESVHGEAQLLDRMIAESEKTLGKIKMIAESKGLSVSASLACDGQGGSMRLSPGTPFHTQDA